MPLPHAIDFVHRLLAGVLRPGAVAVDATAGNGHDTLMLARLVGTGGHVHAFDVQAGALHTTRARLADAGVTDRVTLHQAGHERMGEHLPPGVRGRVRAVAFNLGYLPGGDKTLVTRPGTTVRALDAAADLLAPGGRIGVVCYTGHKGGSEEAAAVVRWASERDQRRLQAVRYAPLNQRNRPPHAVVVERRDEAG